MADSRTASLKALINVAVATEGFDLPDAACVLLTRPTMSLSLYLQMVGRGLRPKKDDGDCVVLDLAGNSLQARAAGRRKGMVAATKRGAVFGRRGVGSMPSLRGYIGRCQPPMHSLWLTLRRAMRPLRRVAGLETMDPKNYLRPGP